MSTHLSRNDESSAEDDSSRLRTHQTFVWIPSGNDVPFVGNTEGPMLQSIRLLRTAHRRIYQQFSTSSSCEILTYPLNHQWPIHVFVDIDYLSYKDGYLRNEFKESCYLFKKSGNFIYGVSSLPMSSTTLDDWNCFTSIHFTTQDDLDKAKMITTIIIQLSEQPKLKLIFGGSPLLELLESEFNNSTSLDLAIKFLDTLNEGQSNQLQNLHTDVPNNQSSTSGLPLNQQQAWMLQDYSIFEYIMYYITINQTIKKESKYFQYEF